MKKCRKRYMFSAWIWAPDEEEYVHIDISIYETFDEAMAVYDVIEPDDHVIQVEIWEERISKFDTVEDSKKIRWKDIAGEYEDSGFPDWHGEADC
ncbi:MAG: hypothetical protein II659_08265 [Bacteroidales bacterium]|nr:hypothetical protein [Bacteroidales bacterium]